jgi:hypothetical protein
MMYKKSSVSNNPEPRNDKKKRPPICTEFLNKRKL